MELIISYVEANATLLRWPSAINWLAVEDRSQSNIQQTQATSYDGNMLHGDLWSSKGYYLFNSNAEHPVGVKANKILNLTSLVESIHEFSLIQNKIKKHW